MNTTVEKDATANDISDESKDKKLCDVGLRRTCVPDCDRDLPMHRGGEVPVNHVDCQGGLNG